MDIKEFEKKWLRAFATCITQEQIDRYYIGINGGKYLWHVFSNNLVEAMDKEIACVQFDNAIKVEAVEIYLLPTTQGYELKILELAKSHQTAKQIDAENLSEFYVIGKDFSWCYMVTHENLLA